MLKLVQWRWKEKEIPLSMGAFRGKLNHFFQRLTGEQQFRSLERSKFAPAIDVSETHKEIIVRAEIPGIDPKDLDVSLVGNTLRISGEKISENEEKGEQFHRVERSFGSFSVSLSLPCQIQEDKIELEQRNGILLLKIPKAEPEALAQEQLEVTQSEQLSHQQHRQMTG
jgi:HSP20 family protein